MKKGSNFRLLLGKSRLKEASETEQKNCVHLFPLSIILFHPLPFSLALLEKRATFIITVFQGRKLLCRLKYSI